MTQSPLYPLHGEADRLLRGCRLPLHTGTAKLADRAVFNDPAFGTWGPMLHAARHAGAEPADLTFDAAVVVPAAGDVLLLLRTASEHNLCRNFYSGLTIEGEGPDGPFVLTCPSFYVAANSSPREAPAWAIASPVNGPATITYGEPRPVSRVVAFINNFDFEYGNVRDVPGAREVLRVEACGRAIDFTWRKCRDDLRRLLAAGAIHSTSLVTFSFAAWDGAAEDDLTKFAWDVAGLCSIVTEQHTYLPVLALLDAGGRVAKRVVLNPIESPFRRDAALHLSLDDGLPMLFRDCFEEYVRMRRSERWGRMQPFVSTVQDPPYLEQKHATLMAAVELLIRNCLLEDGRLTEEQVAGKTLPELIGAARGVLRWDVPNHYTARERHRRLRNAVAHGDELPDDASAVRRDFDKWRLFLLRRLLIRMGFRGKVRSPEKGWASLSRVDNFEEGHNSFQVGPAGQN